MDVLRGESRNAYTENLSASETGYDRTTLFNLILATTAGGAGVAILSLLLLMITGLIAPSTAIGIMASATVSIISSGICYALGRQGRIEWAVQLYGIALVFVVFSAMFLYGGALSPLVVASAIPLTVVGLLATRRTVWVIGSIIVGTYLALAILQNVYPAQIPVQPLSSGAEWFTLMVVAISVGIIGLVTSSVQASLHAALQESQDRAEKIFTDTERLLEKSMQQIELGSELSAAAAELQATSQQQASGSTEQASAVSQVTTTVEELGTTARQIAQSADHVAQAAQQTLEYLSDGQQAVDESIQAMERIRVRMQDISVRVLGLGERSQQIGEIIDLIDDISDETHLLALNAAIEAAGAGEHGRRFSVVAAEVKNLANRTLQAAKEVKDVIAEIRQATNAAVLAAEEGGKEVEKGSELTYRAGQVMDTILMMAERTAQSGAEIGMATAQQQSASEQVVEAMREIAEVARQTAAGARQMADSAAMLSAIADRLHGVAQG
ncbi:MAG: methyl-accepting chemotaxis protein [Chloroflexaceae bacterium]|nr:methyl-accepting chemotaxis protein [Chloroflexaceae bacterium]